MTKNLFYIFLSFLIFTTSCRNNKTSGRDDSLNSLFEEVDHEIENAHLYEQEKQKRIELIKSQYNQEKDNLRRADVGDRLISEYESFISDSALHYVNLNLENPVVAKDEHRVLALQIKKADITAHAGLFGESAALLETIDPSRLDSLLLAEYYAAYCDLYQYQSEYTTDGEYNLENEKNRELYIDSVTNVSDPNSLSFIINKAASDTRNHNFSEAERMLQGKIKEFESGDRNYSILASLLAYLYKIKNDSENYKRYLALSVISDIRGSVKENMAIRELATSFYEDGDIERADRYLRQSFADANFFAARMRNAQSSRMLPVIGEAYNQHQQQMTRDLRRSVVAISILAGFLIIIFIYTVLQIIKVKKANRASKQMLEEVSSLSEQLKEMNNEVVEANRELKRSNKIKEEYAGLFMQYCSLAISNFHQYQQSLKVIAAQGNTKSLLKKIDSADFENKVFKEFYEKFDEAILNIYPDFIDKFNALMQPENRVDINRGENLTTELRIYALIRIGITDSERIARFLGCSLSTIYTYRSKTKKRALDPENFENDIRNLE